MQNKVMRYCIRLTILLGVSIVVGLLVVLTPAQTNPQGRAANLRAQLADTEARQTELQSRLQQFEENLKPDNIERSLAGVGSVHPEELRDARRRKVVLAGALAITHALQQMGAHGTEAMASIGCSSP